MCLTRLAIGNLAFQKRFQLRQRTVELLRDPHDVAGFLDACDRFVENVDLAHPKETGLRGFVPRPPLSIPEHSWGPRCLIPTPRGGPFMKKAIIVMAAV